MNDLATIHSDNGTISKIERHDGILKKWAGKELEARYHQGEELMALRETCGGDGRDGKFAPTLEALGYDRRESYRSISIYEYLSEYVKEVGEIRTLPVQVGTIVELASDNVPEKAKSEAAKKLRSGHRLRIKDAKELAEKYTVESPVEPAAPATEAAEHPDSAPAAAEYSETENEIEIVEATAEERMAADNSAIESFTRQLLKFFDEHVPFTPWMQTKENGDLIESARSSIRAANSTLRLAKGVICPHCDGEGCDTCEDEGYCPKMRAQQVR